MAASQGDPAFSSHHSKHHSAVEYSGANASDESGIKTLEKGMQTGAVDGVGTTGDGKKGSEGRVPPAKPSKTVKIV